MDNPVYITDLHFFQVLKEGIQGDDLNEVAKLFNIHRDPTSLE